MLKKLKHLAVFASALVCLAGATRAHSQTVFYNNTTDDNIYYPATKEIAMPIAFSGSYEVDSFKIGYFLPLDSLNGPTTDVIVNFYSAAPSAGDAFSGYDPVQDYYPNLISSTRLTNLPSEPAGKTNIVNYDLTPFGDYFQWDATLLNTGEMGGWISLQFTNPDAGWEVARGGSQDDIFQDMTDGDFFDFGGTPQAAFYVQLSGQNLTPTAPPNVPEPGTVALLAALSVPSCVVYMRRHKRRG